MAKAIKSVSIFTFLFIFLLVISDMPAIEAQDSECLKEYGGNVGFMLCAPRVFPTFCYQYCRQNKEAKGGKCVWGEGVDVKCFCDFCDDSPSLIQL